jgi:hypothetical protein
VTSSDPSRLLVSADANTPGQPSITVAASPNQQPSVYIQALAATGTATVTVSGDGYEPAMQSVQLVPSAAVFQSAQTQNVTVGSAAQRLSVVIVTLDASSQPSQFYQQTTPRAGANLSVSVTSSDPKVLSVATPSLQFSVAQPSPAAQVQPLSAGTAILSLGLLPGGVAPVSGNQIVFNVK